MLPLAPIALAAINLLPKIPDMWQSIAGIFGKEVPKTVKDAGNLADSIMSSLKRGEVPPEIQVKLEEEANRHKEKLAELAFQEKQLVLDYEYKQQELEIKNASEMIDLEKAAYATEDEYVRRTRPQILREFFTLCKLYSFYAPLAVVAGYSIGLPAVALTAFIDMVLYIAGWLFSVFGASYLGYSVSRSIDKRNPNLKDSEGVAGKVVNTLLKLK